MDKVIIPQYIFKCKLTLLMRQLKFFILFIAVIIFTNACKKESTDNNCNNSPIPSDTYKYPIQPGTPAWSTLKTGEEMLQACQIPDSVLPAISTEGLIQSWQNMPLNNEIFMANSLQKAMEYFIANFSGLRELIGRNDVAVKLFKKYQSMDPTCITTFQTDREKGSFPFLFSYIELPLAQDTILNKMALKQKKELVKEALQKYYSRLEYPADYDVVSRDLSLFICAKAMRNSQYQPFLNQVNDDLMWFILNARFFIPLGDYAAEKDIIISNARNFIK